MDIDIPQQICAFTEMLVRLKNEIEELRVANENLQSKNEELNALIDSLEDQLSIGRY